MASEFFPPLSFKQNLMVEWRAIALLVHSKRGKTSL